VVIPNGCEDGEANCKPVNNRYTQVDDFLAREVPKIEASPAFGRNGVIIITYDEDERAGGLASKNGLGEGGHVVCAVISPLAVPGTYDEKSYHYSVLRTLEDGFGIPSISATPTTSPPSTPFGPDRTNTPVCNEEEAQDRIDRSRPPEGPPRALRRDRGARPSSKRRYGGGAVAMGSCV
jgi:hypothetical protein